MRRGGVVYVFVATSSLARAHQGDEAPSSATIPETAPKPVQHKPRPFASEPETEPERAKARVSIEWLPLRLLIPAGAVAAEVRLHDRASVTASFGYGTAQVAKVDGNGRAPAVQAGFAAQWYVGGTFEDGGIHLGAAALYTHVGDATMRLRTSLVQPGFLAGPLIGFKYVVGGGFTFDSQLGIGFAFGSGGAPPVEEDKPTALIGDVGIGWTF